MTKRTYRMTRRADAKDETRLRIVEAAIALHEELGPKDTSIKAIAERAGVQRLTVYRHFPDDETLLDACSSSWMDRTPPPGAEDVEGAGPAACAAGLAALFRYYSGTRRMWTSVLADEGEVAALAGPLGGYSAYLDAYAGALAGTLGGASASVGVTLRHAVDFQAWRSLDERGLTDGEKAELVTGWLRCLAACG